MKTPLLTVSASPHLLGKATVRNMNVETIIALVPALVAGFYYFGTPGILTVAVAVASTVVFEFLCVKIFGQKNRLDDFHAVLMGLLLGMVLPAGAPLWIPVMGGLLTIGLAKMIFGGVGGYPMHPVLIAWAALQLSWPEQMKAFYVPLSETGVYEVGKSALAQFTADVAYLKKVDVMALWCGYLPGAVGATSAWALMIGGIYLVIRRIVNWRIPLAILVGTLVMSLIAAWTDPTLGALKFSGFGDTLRLAWFHMGAGGLMICAFFLAAEPLTSPVTCGGRIAFGLGIGIMAVIVRTWGAAGDGAYYAVLLMSAATPLFDRIRPRVIGKPVRPW